MIVFRHKEKGALIGFAIWALILGFITLAIGSFGIKSPLAMIIYCGWLFNLPALLGCMAIGVALMAKVSPATTEDWSEETHARHEG